MLSSRVRTVEALVVYLDIDNQLGLLQNNFDSSLEVFTQHTLIATARYMDVGVFVRYNLSGLDSKQHHLEELVRLYLGKL